MDPWTYAKAGCSEHASQVALFMWAKMAETYGVQVANDPRSYGNQAYAQRLAREPLKALRWLFAVPNGGERAMAVASSMAAEGAKRGVADVILPLPAYKHPISNAANYYAVCGLFIEMKKEMYRKHKDGGCKQEQLDFGRDMQEAGYSYHVCYTWIEAVKVILSYLGACDGGKELLPVSSEQQSS